MSVPGQNRFAARGTHRIAYEIIPAAEEPAPAVVLLHGLLAGRAEWATVRDLLAGDLTLVLPEARGHGASAAISGRRYTLADLAADTLAVLDHAALSTVHVVGHGLGGAIAWEVGRAAPERVASLTLVEPDLPALLDGDLDPVAGSLRQAARRADRAAADAADRGQLDRALDAYLGHRHGSDWRERHSPAARATARRHAPALTALLTALADYVPTFATELESGPPLLILHGGEAPPLVALTGHRLVARVPGARLESLPAADAPDNPLAGAAGVALAARLRHVVATASPRPVPGR